MQVTIKGISSKATATIQRDTQVDYTLLTF